MALIKCSECGKEISDKATTCIHCGCPIEKELICNECGKKLDKNDKVCKCCGCPIENLKEKKEKNDIKGFIKIWLIICSVVCLLISIFLCFVNVLNIAISTIRIGSLNINVMGALTLLLGCAYIILLKNLSKKNFIVLVIINALIFIYNMFSFQMVINLFFIICVILNVLITFFVVKKDLNNTKLNIKEYILLLIAIIIALSLSFVNGNDYNSDDYYYEDTTLTQNEQKVYDTLVDIYLDRAYNPQAVRVVSGNTLYGFKISGTNQVGATITNCISLMPANYRDKDTCSSVHNDVSEDSEWYIDVYKINKKLEEYWNNKGM